MLQRAMTVGGGASQVPFELSDGTDVGFGRVTINSQNNYIYNDNGVLKIHIEVNCTATVSMSSNWIFLICVPNKTLGTPNVNSNDYAISQTNIGAPYNSVYCVATKGSISSGTTFTVLLDYDM